MPYKRLSQFSETFSIPQFLLFGTKREFFNSHAIYQQLCCWLKVGRSGKVFLIFSSKLNLCGSFRKVAIFFATCVWRRLTLTASSKRSFTPTVVPLNRR